MKAEEIAGLLSETFGEKVLESQLDGPTPWSVVEPEDIFPICRFMHDDGRLLCDHLEMLGGVDYKDRVEVVYVMYSMKHHHRYTLKVRLPREEPKVHTVESIWAVANWHERETYDLVGVVFEGHSDLRRILLPYDWEGYPLRRDYKYPTSYHDLPV